MSTARRLRALLLGLAISGIALVALVACATQAAAIPEGLTAGEIFQRAQDAAESGAYPVAIQYYTLFQQKYPEDWEHGVWASYEIAFLYHKTGKDAEALKLLDDLLAMYAKEGAIASQGDAGAPQGAADQQPVRAALPPAPRILAEKLKSRLQESATTAP
jgi:tetratricopeptide (TPR) repeat protein